MRRLLPVAIVSALVGALTALAAVTLVEREPDRTTTVVRQAPLARTGDDRAALTAAEIYARHAPGVVFIRADVVQQQVSPFGLPTESRGESTGSGFVVDDDGTILTNAHVVEGAAGGRVQVTFADRATATARVRGTDISTDVAVLRVDPRTVELHPLVLGTARDVRVGDPVVAIGNPFGLDRTLTTGVISAEHRRIEAPDGFEIQDVLQTDAAINPGNSGGPLIDGLGRVIGITSQISTATPDRPGSNGIAFAIPIDTVRRVVEELRREGSVDRGYLGVDGLTIDARLQGLDLPVDAGVLVQQVTPGSPADRAGVQGGNITAQLGADPIVLGGDIITEIDGRPVRTADELRQAVAARKSGSDATITVVRGDDEREVEVELARRPGDPSP